MFRVKASKQDITEWYIKCSPSCLGEKFKLERFYRSSDRVDAHFDLWS